jgi:hypothetical protein
VRREQSLSRAEGKVLSGFAEQMQSGAEYQNLMQWRTDLCLNGQVARLAEQYLYPLTIHAGERTLVVADAAEMTGLLESWRADWKARGVARAVVEVTAADAVRYSRLRIWTTVREFGTTGLLLGQKHYIQHCRKTAKGLRTEMAEIIPASAAQTWPAEGRGR